MKFFLIILSSSLAVLLFVNIWRVYNFGDGGNPAGFRMTMDYLSTYRGWTSTVSMFNDINEIFNVDNIGEGILTILSPLWAPIAVGIAIISDIIYHITFFFGWIPTAIFGNGSQSSTDINDLTIVSQQISFVPLIRSIGV